MNKYKILWDSLMGLLYWLTFFLDPYIFAFQFDPLEQPSINRFQRFLTFVIFLDMIIAIFTGIPREDASIQTPLDAHVAQETLAKSGKQEKEKRRGDVKSL